MKLRRPPAIAAWLIERNSPLAGDLLEEFQRGKSRGWFWRQALMAVLTGLGHNVRVSRLYLKAYLIGFAAQAVVVFILRRRFHHLVDFVAYPVLLLAVPAAVFMRKIAGSHRVDLSRILADRVYLSRILAECGEMESQKRTAISMLVALWAFSLYLCLNSDLIMQVLFFSFDVLPVVFRRPGITPASGKRP
jgi:hypothetical protein